MKCYRPGQDLPDFPKPTHSMPWTVFDALEEVNRYLRRQQSNMYDYEPLLSRPKKGYNPRITLAHTVTTNGGENCHWNGRRQFTIRELLALQTFPLTYLFGVGKNGRSLSRKEILVQIGNAVPPKFARLMMASVLAALQKTDAAR